MASLTRITRQWNSVGKGINPKFQQVELLNCAFSWNDRHIKQQKSLGTGPFIALKCVPKRDWQMYAWKISWTHWCPNFDDTGLLDQTHTTRSSGRAGLLPWSDPAPARTLHLWWSRCQRSEELYLTTITWAWRHYVQPRQHGTGLSARYLSVQSW